MSKYTTELRYICESKAKEAGLDIAEATVTQIIRKAAPEIFDFHFPIFSEDYRIPLETKILKHFYTREICAETYARWRLFLDDTMNIIMPYYNKLYESETFKFNPLYDVDYTISKNETRSANTNEEETKSSSESGNAVENTTNNWQNTGNNTGTDWDKYSETPQGGLAGIDPDGQIGSYYLTNVRKKNGNTSTTANGSGSDNKSTTMTSQNSDTKHNNKTINDMNDYIERVNGKRSGTTITKMLVEYRNSLINIDAMIIGELETLFMGIW